VRALVLLALAASLSGCSADAVEPAEPELWTPGAFVATAQQDGLVGLHRVLSVEPLPPQPGVENTERNAILHLTAYQETAASFDEARELAQKHTLTPATKNYVQLASTFADFDYRIVWYRTLTAEERP
jgi:hypothetical protein